LYLPAPHLHPRDAEGGLENSRLAVLIRAAGALAPFDKA
jgi:hypothetical protein